MPTVQVLDAGAVMQTNHFKVGPRLAQLRAAALRRLGLDRQSERCLLLLPMLESACQERVLSHQLFSFMLRDAAEGFGLRGSDARRLRRRMSDSFVRQLLDYGAYRLMSSCLDVDSNLTDAELLEALIWAELVRCMAHDPTCHPKFWERNSGSAKANDLVAQHRQQQWFDVWMDLAEHDHGSNTLHKLLHYDSPAGIFRAAMARKQSANDHRVTSISPPAHRGRRWLRALAAAPRARKGVKLWSFVLAAVALGKVVQLALERRAA